MNRLTFLSLIVVVSCNQSVKNRQVEDNVDTSYQNVIIDPIIPANYEITHYDRVVKISDDIFPKGAHGIGFAEIFIDTSAIIKKFEITSANIYIGEKRIYNYSTDRNTTQTVQLTNRVDKLVKSVEIRKLTDSILDKPEIYNLPIKFE